ncbi:MAG: TIGR00289 family protein [Methanosarcinales archaeon]|nr:MAG: TIGR00289 family protein [Methanosarcinales archaeon]
MKLAALISGGKDSSFAMYKALQAGHEITNLIVIKSQNPDSYMYHTPNIHLTELFAEATGIPLISKLSSGEKEREVDDLKMALQQIEVDGVVMGAIESEYQASRIRHVCESLGLEMYAPLWHQDPEALLREMVEILDVRIVHVSALGLDEDWLGRKIDRRTIEELKALKERYGIHIAGEGGEYESLVVDAPFFTKRIELVKTKKVWRDNYGTLNVLEAALAEK